MQAPHDGSSGLIDFNDSAFRIDLNQYAQQPMPLAQQVALHNQMAAGAAAGGHVLTPAQSPMLATHVLAGPNPMFAQQPPAMFAQQPNPFHYAPAPLLAAPNGASNQFIAGPPSFVQHLSGQVYKLETEATPAATVPEPEPEAKAAKTQKSLERLVEERVQSRVEEFIAKTADPEKRTTRRRGGANKSNAAKLDELNASMRNAIYSR